MLRHADMRASYAISISPPRRRRRRRCRHDCRHAMPFLAAIDFQPLISDADAAAISPSLLLILLPPLRHMLPCHAVDAAILRCFRHAMPPRYIIMPCCHYAYADAQYHVIRLPAIILLPC